MKSAAAAADDGYDDDNDFVAVRLTDTENSTET